MTSIHRASIARLRGSVGKWLFCWDGLHAAFNLLLVVGIIAVTWHARQIVRDFVAILVIPVLYRPVLYFFFPPLFLLTLLVIMKLPHKQKGAYPCPVCGYDIRETLSRCPECGTELQWGQLPDEPIKPGRSG
jgi:hypothetical protein